MRPMTAAHPAHRSSTIRWPPIIWPCSGTGAADRSSSGPPPDGSPLCWPVSPPTPRALTVICGAIDDRLDERGFIIPGLGDAGDRLYGRL